MMNAKTKHRIPPPNSFGTILYHRIYMNNWRYRLGYWRSVGNDVKASYSSVNMFRHAKALHKLLYAQGSTRVPVID